MGGSGCRAFIHSNSTNDTRQREGDFTIGKTKHGENRECLGAKLSGSRRGSYAITIAGR